MKGKCDIVLTDLMIKTYKVWRYRLNYVLSKYTQMTRTSPYVGSSHANIQLKNSTALLPACLPTSLPQLSFNCRLDCLLAEYYLSS